MIRKFALAIAPAVLLAAPAIAQDAILTGEVEIDYVDTNADGMVSLMELQAAWPQLTEADFVAWDVNADGSLDTEELSAAFEAGYIPDPGLEIGETDEPESIDTDPDMDEDGDDATDGDN